MTHNDIDLTRALREIADRNAARRVTIGSYVDTGQATGVGTEDPAWSAFWQ